jgi:hypothetical protein
MTAALAVALVGTGCAPERATAPDLPTPAAARNAGGSGATSFFTPVLTDPGTTVPVVQRDHALAADISVTQTITPRGGVIRIGAAGLWLVFAPGAVSAPLQVTATANAGSGVVYSFEPHGTVFTAPVYVVQDLRITTIRNDLNLASTIAGAYMPDGLADLSPDGLAKVSELHEAVVDKGHVPGMGLVLTQAVFEIQHFSGYILTVGRR